MVISAFHGERLRLARVALGLTLDQLGARVSATRQYLNQLEQGLKVPTDEMRAALAALLAASAVFLAAHVLRYALARRRRAEQAPSSPPSTPSASDRVATQVSW